MKNLRHPNFILALFSGFVLLIGIIMKFNKYTESDYVIGAGALLAGVHWIWAIIDVINRSDLKAFQKRFWLIVVIAVPVLGAMVFYTLHQEKDKIVT